MCRWLAYSGRSIFMETLVSRPCHSLIHQSQSATECKVATNGDGVGIGWYGAHEEPGVYRDILPAWSDDNLKNLCRQITSPLFFAHVRASTGTATNRANCHPFTFGRWMFMHNGQIGGYEKIRRKIDALLPDDRYGARRGTTDSEALFLMLDPEMLARDPVRAMEEVLIAVRGRMSEAGITEPLRFAAALSDGRSLTAFRYSSDERPPTLYWRQVDGDTSIVSEPLDDTKDGWTALAPYSALTVTPSGRVVLSEFRVDRDIARSAA